MVLVRGRPKQLAFPPFPRPVGPGRARPSEQELASSLKACMGRVRGVMFIGQRDSFGFILLKTPQFGWGVRPPIFSHAEHHQQRPQKGGTAERGGLDRNVRTWWFGSTRAE